jgi:integrase
MSLSTNVVRRIGSRNYYARLAVPKDLQHRMGTTIGKPKRELWQSLNTSDPREAKRAARPVVEAWERQFAELRLPRHLSEGELQDAVWQRYLELITADEKFRQSMPSNADLDEIWKHLEREFGEYELDAFRILELIRDQFQANTHERSIRFSKLKTDTARGETELVADVVRKIIDDRRLDLETHSDEYRKLAQGIQRAELEALTRGRERDAGVFSGAPADPLVQPPTIKPQPASEGIVVLFDRFRQESSNAVSADTWSQNRKIVVLFDEFVGGKAHVSAINRKNVRDWKANLFKWPVKAADTNAFKGLSFLKVIEKNETIGKPFIQPKTINRYLSAIGSFSGWLLSNDFLETDVMAGMYLDYDRETHPVLPYTAEQLGRIFRSPLFHRCGGDKREAQTGKVEIRDWRYWIPYIGLYTGARLGEIAQLLTADVRQLHGVWIFHVTREGSKTKSTKTRGSERVVPMHSKLIEMGFLDYHARMKAQGHKNLFPEIKPDARGFRSGTPSSFLNDYFRDIGVKLDKSVNFHSFRHGIADAFRAAGYLDEQFNMLLGHTKATTTGRYGILPQGILSERVKMIEAVAFTGLAS